MGNLSHSLLQLHDLASFLDSEANLEQSLGQLAEMAAKILNAGQCSIMLLDEEEKDEIKLRVFASYGSLPDAAFKQITKKGEGISGHVLSTGQPLLVEDIQQSEFATVARRLSAGSKSLISAPIVLRRNIVGVINVSDPKTKRPFNLDDLHLLDVVSLFVGKSVQVAQLQSVLNSRFAQIALAQEANHAIGAAMASVS